MDINSVFFVGTIIVLVVGVVAAFYHYKKRNLEKFFNQIYEESKQVPKQKKNSFLLLMFKESLSASIKKTDKASFSSRLKNPKYLEIQLVQMSKILKDSSNVQDKVIKRSLHLLSNYQTWEKTKIAKDKTVIKDKAS